MQVRGMGTALGPQYNGALHALVAIVKTEGIAGLYRGIWANLCEWPFCGTGFRIKLNRSWLCSTVKVAPSIATSFFTYELVKEKILGGS